MEVLLVLSLCHGIMYSMSLLQPVYEALLLLYSSLFCSKMSLVYNLSDEIGYQYLLYNQAGIQR